MKNKVILILVVLAMFGQVTLTANANTIDTSTGTGESSVTLSQEKTSFNVTVPTSLPVAVDRDGVVATASDVTIHNNSYGPVIISDIRVDVINGWSLVDFDKDMSKSKLGLKEFGFSIQNDKVQPNGSVPLTPSSWGSVSGGAIKRLNYDAIVSPQKTALADENIANVVFILGWDEEPEYVLATDDDFSGTEDGTFKYIGTDEYVEVPHVIKGVPVTSYSSVFRGTSVKGVKSTNTNVTDMSNMFRYCKTLQTIDLSNFNTSNVTNMQHMFYECSNLTSLDLSKFDTSNVTNMTYMFEGCTSLQTLDLSSFNTSNVTKMGQMFNGCTNLTTLDLSNFDTSNVTAMTNMFNRCTNLTTLDLSSFDTSNVTAMTNMFTRCTNLTTLDLSSFDTTNVTDMDYMFTNCTSLQTGYAKTQADANKFNSSEGKPEGLTFIIKEVEPEETSKYTLATDDDFSGDTDGEFKYIGKDEYVEIPHKIKGVAVTSYKNMFAGTSVKGVKSTNTNVNDTSSMFFRSQATTLDLSNFDTSNVTNMGYMFNECSNLTSLDLSNFKTSNVTKMREMFNNCKSLQTLDLSSFNTSNVTDMTGMFYYCSNLTTLDLSSFNTGNVAYISKMFSCCQNLTTLDLSSFDTSNVTSMDNMFSFCTNLTTLDLSNFDTSNVTHMSRMFMYCSNLTSLDLRSFDTGKLTNKGSMFEECTSLQTGYARTQEDADKFNDSNGKPSGLTFVVKE